MPLHLLGKKSWNVYNKDNIERVKRDEEEARLAQQAEERRRHDNEATDRLELLRQSQNDAVIDSERPISRKRPREDDVSVGAKSSKHRHQIRDDEAGTRERAPRRSEAQKSDDPLDNITNMRFRDAAGRNSGKPWYSSLNSTSKDLVGKDVWGNEDSGRQTRDQNRLVANDPLLSMKRGVRQLRESEKQKAEWRRERERDLNEVEELARKERRRDRDRDKPRRHHSRDRVRHRSSRHHRHRSRSPRRHD